MENFLYPIIEQYGVYAIFVLCMVEGDITLLIAGVMAQSRFFGEYSFLKVFLFGTAGGVAGDTFGYFVGRVFAKTISNYKFYQRSQPRIENLVEKFGGYALVISKYIYGIRVAICISSGVGKMPLLRFLANDLLSCSIWALILSGLGYFFSGFVTQIIGDFQQIGVALLVIVVLGIAAFYFAERFWLSKKVESASPETIHEIEERIHDITENIQEKLHLTHHAHNEETDSKLENQPAEVEKDAQVK
jgi:membrane protein DedA with SNARE-associated domain